MSAQQGKENNKSASNMGGCKGTKKFTRGNTSLQGKVFEISAKDVMHQFTDTIRVIADYVGQEYTHSGDIRFMVENFEDYNFQHPEKSENGKNKLDLYWSREEEYTNIIR
jgi:hypothetical protein